MPTLQERLKSVKIVYGEEDTFNVLRKWIYEDARNYLNEVIKHNPSYLRIQCETMLEEKTGWTYQQLAVEQQQRYVIWHSL